MVDGEQLEDVRKRRDVFDPLEVRRHHSEVDEETRVERTTLEPSPCTDGRVRKTDRQHLDMRTGFFSCVGGRMAMDKHNRGCPRSVVGGAESSSTKLTKGG